MSANRKIGKGVVYGDPAHVLVLMKKHRKICLSKWKKLLFFYFKCFYTSSRIKKIPNALKKFFLIFFKINETLLKRCRLKKTE